METVPFIEHNHETEHTLEINSLQIDLIKSWDIGLDDDNEKFSKWTELYSKTFREIIDGELDRNKDFWRDFDKPGFRDELIRRISDKLYR
mgnify:FL=1